MNIDGKVWPTAVVLASGLGFWAAGVLPLTVLAAVLVFVVLLGVYVRTSGRIVRISIWPIALACGVFIGIHRPEGFNYPLLFSVDQLHEGGKPFALYLNVAKALAGFAALIWLIKLPNPSQSHSFVQRGLATFAYALGAVLFVVLLAVLLLDLQWAPKFSQLTLIFSLQIWLSPLYLRRCSCGFWFSGSYPVLRAGGHTNRLWSLEFHCYCLHSCSWSRILWPLRRMLSSMELQVLCMAYRIQ